MTEEAFVAQKNRIEAILEDVLVALGMAGHWDIGVQYVNGLSDDDDETWMSHCRCNARWEYQQAQLQIFVEAMAPCSDAEVQGDLIHEMMHALVREMREWMNADPHVLQTLRSAECHEERVVSALTKALSRACRMVQEGEWKVLVGAESRPDSDTEKVVNHG